VLRVVAGDIPRTTALLALKFDFIFFTGTRDVHECHTTLVLLLVVAPVS
jgi:hypothetical protein